MKKTCRAQPLPQTAGLIHEFRLTPLALALLCVVPTAAQAALNLPPFQIDPGLMQPAGRTQPAQPIQKADTPPPGNAAPTVAVPPPEPLPAPATAAAPIIEPQDSKKRKAKPAAKPTATKAPAMELVPAPAMRAAGEAPTLPAAPVVQPLAAAPAVRAEEEQGEPLPLKRSRNLTYDPPPGTESTPIFVSGMKIQGHQDVETEVIGDAELRQWGKVITADLLRYNKPEDTVFAQNNVRIDQKGDIVEGPELKLQMETNEGYMQQPVFQLGQQMPPGRGDAKMLLFEGENQYHLEDTRYTTCSADSDDWFLHAKDLEINRTTQIGTAHNAYVEFLGMPILYTPWMDFSLSKERKSGFLTPSFGTSGKNGAQFALPYYWNIAPNRDATITPRVMTKRGMQVSTEFRYLDPSYIGTANLEILPNDRMAGIDRHFMSLKHQHNLGQGWAGTLNLERASDDNYFRDLSTQIAATSQVNLMRDALLAYTGMPGWVFTARSQSFQTLQDPLAPITTPYRRSQLVLNGSRGLGLGSSNWGPGAILNLNSEAVDFSHPTLLNGKRFTLYPSISLPLNQIYGYITPKIGVHYTRYNFGDNATPQPDMTRTLPIFTLDSGLYFDRKVDLFGSSYEQTLEPRLYYVRTPFRDQSQIPLFDSGDFGFGMPQIFSENRFTGNDRISDANQITAGVTSRIMDDMGLELLRGTVAQRYYLSLPQVTLPGGTPPTRKYSDILISLGGKLAQGLNLYSLWQYDPEQKQTSNLTVNGRYLPAPGKALNVSYRYTPSTPITPVALKQIDTSAQWPLTSRWNALARWNYSIFDNKVLESLAGLEYNAGCWAFRAVVHSLATSSTDRSNAIFFQLELNGVSSIGSNPLDVLRRNIYGYTKTTDIPYENDTPYLP